MLTFKHIMTSLFIILCNLTAKEINFMLMDVENNNVLFVVTHSQRHNHIGIAYVTVIAIVIVTEK